FTDQFSVSLNLRAYKSEWNSAGYLPARLNLPKTAWVDDGSGEGNGGERSRFDGRLWANYLLNDESQFTFYAFGTDLDNTRWQTSYPGDAWRIGRPAPGNFSGGTEQTNTRKAYGGGLAYNYKGEWADKAANLTIGLEYLNENEKRDQYRLPWGTGRTRGTHYTETDYILKTTSLFAESSYQILEPLQVRLGGRYDRLTGELDTGPNQTGALGANRHYDAKTRGFFSPKAGLLLTPLDWLDVYTNFGRGYGLPGLNNGDFFAQERFELTVRDQVELGYRLRPTDWLDLEMIYFHIWTDKDQTYDPLAPLGQEMQNAGSTRRKGLETLVSLHPFDFWTLSANHTWQIAEYKKNANSQFLLDGYKMTGVPDSITNLELAYAPDYGLGGRLNFRYEAGELLRNNPAVTRLGAANTDPYRYYEAPDKTSLDLQLSYKFDDSYKLTVDVMNVLNRENYGSVGAPSVSNLGITDYTYSIQPPLTVYVSLGINWN
ncbi:MAG: TonB-dependent receptor, partial [Candidatus Adiutrix sp.]|nr:TonB-dependent receptor [Candidatus Adiutrix sp.]